MNTADLITHIILEGALEPAVSKKDIVRFRNELLSRHDHGPVKGADLAGIFTSVWNEMFGYEFVTFVNSSDTDATSAGRYRASTGEIDVVVNNLSNEAFVTIADNAVFTLYHELVHRSQFDSKKITAEKAADILCGHAKRLGTSYTGGRKTLLASLKKIFGKTVSIVVVYRMLDKLKGEVGKKTAMHSYYNTPTEIQAYAAGNSLRSELHKTTDGLRQQMRSGAHRSPGDNTEDTVKLEPENRKKYLKTLYQYLDK